MLLRLSFISLIIWFIYMIPSQFLNLDIFKIKKINIGENSKILNEELSAVAEKIYDKSIWQIDMKKLKQELSKDIRLESVEISHDKVGELNFKIEEKELLYYAQIGERIYLMDKKGEVFGYFNERDKMSLPLLVSKDGKNVSSLVEVLSNLQEYSFYDSISQIYEVDRNRIDIILIDGTKIFTNTSVDKKKYKVAMALYFEIIKNKKIAYMDLRFQDFIIRYVEDDNGR
ncbi:MULTISPECIES: cell division protein FtsQ/DivIB [Fusobacterium]|nr:MULTISPECIES: cell division protein FtsQ/DivIB [Fusobacterium]AVQ16238.1 cell division protein FtsQ [Fusobacterium gonidiaformans ATCC 25563]EFS28543.2 hypothetical protein FGAG_00864 [Fusobacterium gonidiaformans ATCC 25563]